MSCGARGRGIDWSLLHAPWDTSLNMSTAVSAQECAEGDFVAEQTWRAGENLPKHTVSQASKLGQQENSESSHCACVRETVEVFQ